MTDRTESASAQIVNPGAIIKCVGRSSGSGAGDRSSNPGAPVSLSEPLLRADDIAALFQLPVSTVYEYARRQGDPLPALRLGRHIRFVRQDVELWLGRQRDPE